MPRRNTETSCVVEMSKLTYRTNDFANEENDKETRKHMSGATVYRFWRGSALQRRRTKQKESSREIIPQLRINKRCSFIPHETVFVTLPFFFSFSLSSKDRFVSGQAESTRLVVILVLLAV